MIAALLLGREGSKGFPGKNTHLVLGRPMMSYPILAALNSRYVDEVYVSTDSDSIRTIGQGMGCRIIRRPPELATAEALGAQRAGRRGQPRAWKGEGDHPHRGMTMPTVPKPCRLLARSKGPTVPLCPIGHSTVARSALSHCAKTVPA